MMYFNGKIVEGAYFNGKSINGFFNNKKMFADYGYLLTVDTSLGMSLRLRGLTSGSAAYQIDWGDGVIQNSTADITHTYTSVGIFDVKITGKNMSTVVPQAFLQNMQNVIRVSLGFKPTSLISYCFCDCSAITDFQLDGSNLTQIGDYAFRAAFAPGGKIEIDLSSADNLTTIGNTAFNSSNLHKFIMSPRANYTLSGTSNFKDCKELVKVYLGKPTSLTSNCLSGCLVITDIYIHSEIPPAITSTTIASVPALQNIHVPAESVEAYKTATNWTVFASKIIAI